MPAEATRGTVRLAREEDGVVVLVLSHPPVNALSHAVLSDLDEGLRSVGSDPAARALVVASDTPQFSAGADLKEIAALDPGRAPELVRYGQSVFGRLASLDIPTIAAVHGLAVGGGLELCLACDLRVADDSAKFGAPEVMHGLMPAWGGTQRLPRVVGLSKAQELVFTGQLVSANEALRIGLVNKTVPSGQELRAARDIAHTIGQRAPRAVRAAKRALLRALDSSLAEGLGVEADLVLTEILPSRDLAEGLRAFAERRPAKFVGE